MNEVVKFHNDLNQVVMRGWSAVEMDMFFSILTEVRDKGAERVDLKTDQLKQLAGYNDQHISRFVKSVKSLQDKILNLKWVEEEKNGSKIKIKTFNLFEESEVEIDEKTGNVNGYVSISKKFEYIVNKLNANFTTYELKEFTSLKSSYAKTMYRLLKQWRKVGKKRYPVEEFRILLDIPKSYSKGTINRAVLGPIMKELPQYFDNFKCKKIQANTKGNPITHYEFTWTPEQTGKWDPNKYEKKQGNKIVRKETLPDWFGKETTENDYIDPEVEKDFNEKLKKLREDKK